MRNILLISPASDNEALWLTGTETTDVKNNILPLGLATIAGLTPDDFQVDIWDELVHGVIDDRSQFRRNYDLVGVTGYKAHLPRCRELAGIFRRRSIPVVIGGPGVSATPSDYRADFDVLFVGEAEKTWPRFLQDWMRGIYEAEYRQIEKIDMTQSFLPRWDSIAADISKYAMGSVQTTRGCPFDCEFCDVIYLFGRRPRHKPVKNVLQEVAALERLGVKSIFFCDDEFIGDRSYVKELLRELVPLNRSFRMPLSFSTQLTLTVSRDEELLSLLADANFYMLFIGIETPNEESLRESNKIHNIRGNIAEDVHKILSYGLAIRAGIIVGFDHDDVGIFDMQYDFIQKSYLPSVAINMLKAPSGTRLWTRLREEGRVVSIPPAVRHRLGHPRSYTNMLPKRMTRVELMQGYKKLLTRVFAWESFAERMSGFIALQRRQVAGDGRVQTENAQTSAVPADIGAEGERTAQEVLRAAAAKAPHLLGRVRALIVQHAKYRESINRLLPQLDRQIQLESSGELVFAVDNRPLLISSSFVQAYKAVFPEAYRRVYANLQDRGRLSEALVAVFVDFLVRCGEGFSRWEPHHRVYLEEICDRTCARFNGQPPEQYHARLDGAETIPDITRLRLADDILKNVEQMLQGMAKAE